MAEKLDIHEEYAHMDREHLEIWKKECREKIDELQEQYKAIDEQIWLKDLNGKLARIMGKWVKVRNYSWFDEENEDCYGYRVFKVVGVVRWINGNRFDLKIRDCVFSGLTGDWNKSKQKLEQHQQLTVIGNSDEYETADITKWKVISERQAREFMQKASEKMARSVNKITAKIKG